MGYAISTRKPLVLSRTCGGLSIFDARAGERRSPSLVTNLYGPGEVRTTVYHPVDFEEELDDDDLDVTCVYHCSAFAPSDGATTVFERARPTTTPPARAPVDVSWRPTSARSRFWSAAASVAVFTLSVVIGALAFSTVTAKTRASSKASASAHRHAEREMHASLSLKGSRAD